MPQLCDYKMCHNLGVSKWYGYCSENHYKRALALKDPEVTKEIDKKVFEEMEKIVALLESQEKTTKK